MIQKKKPGVDVILSVLMETQAAFPDSEFINSLLFQYQERGGLSKKQLQGLYGKACRVEGMPGARLATLQAIILKKPTRYKSPGLSVAATALPQNEEHIIQTIDAILQKYPQHKRVLFYKGRCNNRELLTAAEVAELEKFRKILLKDETGQA